MKLQTRAELIAKKEEDLKMDLEALELKEKGVEACPDARDIFSWGQNGKHEPRIIFFFDNPGFSSKYEEPTKEKLVQFIADIMEKFPVGDRLNPPRTAGEDYDTISKFKLRIDNPCKGKHKARLDYYAEDGTCIQIEFNEETMYGGFLGREWRSITDSEHHYFTGTSRKDLMDMRFVRKYLKGFPIVRYYGGNTTSYVTDEDALEAFDTMLLKGIELED